jgi:hypothetical protein
MANDRNTAGKIDPKNRGAGSLRLLPSAPLAAIGPIILYAPHLSNLAGA